MEEFVLLLYYFYRLYMYMCAWYIFVCFIFFSSPYMLVFGNDRVRGTREQVIMQVELVRLSCGEGMIMGSFSLCYLKWVVKAHGIF